MYLSEAIYVASRCARLPIAAEEFAKKIGKTLAGAPFLLGGWLTISGEVNNLIALLKQFIDTNS